MDENENADRNRKETVIRMEDVDDVAVVVVIGVGACREPYWTGSR